MDNAACGHQPFLEGENIVLRAIRLSDVTEEYQAWMNDAEVTRFLESRFFPHTKERLQEYVERLSRDPTSVFLAIRRRHDGAHIGNIKLDAINWIHRFADIGLLIGDRSSWGKGYGTEAVRLVVTYAFQTLNLHKINAGCYSTNESSIRVFKKAGFIEEGRCPQHFFCEGTYVDYVLLSMINSTA